MNLSSLEDLLGGSPYSPPADPAAVELLEDLGPRLAELEARCDLIKAAVSEAMSQQITRARRTTEIYESNAIEGKQASLSETYEILQQRDLWSADAALARYTLHEALSDEPKITDVVGLAAARILVDQWVREPDRPLSESDIRDMHRLILATDVSAGSYKQYLNSIQGSHHTPTPPVDVPAAMDQLVHWFRRAKLPLVWRAAVAHAWLTHIHPFDDGNGRIARLVANYALGFGAYPPLIVSSTADRGRYLSALAHSDEAGDIVPLVRVFVRVLNRQAKLMEDPSFAWSLFQKDLQVREQSVYKRWLTTMDFFLTEVASHLLISGDELVSAGSLSASDFDRLCNRDRLGNSWIARARRGSIQADLLIWAGHTSHALDRHLESDQAYPALFLAEKNPDFRAVKPYLSRVRGLPPTYDEVCVVADEERAYIRRGDRVQQIKLRDAAELWAGILSSYLAALERETG